MSMSGGPPPAPRRDDNPYLFFSLLQAPSSELTLMVEPNADAGAAAAIIRDVLEQLDPGMPTLRMMTLEEHTRFAYYEPHVTAVVVGKLGGAGLLLSLVGLYGVVPSSSPGGRAKLACGWRSAPGRRTSFGRC
jgi:hypothetical protein